MLDNKHRFLKISKTTSKNKKLGRPWGLGSRAQKPTWEKKWMPAQSLVPLQSSLRVKGFLSTRCYVVTHPLDLLSGI